MKLNTGFRIFVQSDKFRNDKFYTMSKTSIKEYAQALQLALQESRPEDYEVVVENLVAVMRESGDLDKYEAVVAEYERIHAESGEVKQVEATFAREATSNKRILNELNDIVGPQIEVRAKVDDGLIGGMVLRVDDTLIDASVKGNLDNLKQELSE